MSQIHNWISNAVSTFSSWITYVWAALTGVTAVLSFQDYTFIIGTVVGAVCAVRTYRINRAEKLASIEEKIASIADKQRRTDLYAEWLKNADPNKPPAAVEIVESALERASSEL